MTEKWYHYELNDHGALAPVSIKQGMPQYFLDDTLISFQHHITRRWLPATVFPEPVVVPDKPWEPRMLAIFGTVLEQPNSVYRMYYTGFTGNREQHSKIFMAESEDGFRWHKPELGIVQWRESRNNNISLAPEHSNDSPSVVYDPEDTRHPYKLVVFGRTDIHNKWGPDWGIYAYGSQDGIGWQRREPHILVRAGDRTNAMTFKTAGKYIMYTRHPEMIQSVGCRALYRSESPDFVSWTEPELVLAPDMEDAPDVEYYGMSVFERNGWYFGLLEYWEASVDALQTHLVFSRDGKTWRHVSPRASFIAPAHDWNRTWVNCASNGPIIIDDVMIFYFGGRWMSHHYDRAQQMTGIGYASLPIDRFCALEGKCGGCMVTRPIEWPGGELLLNADTRGDYTHPVMCNGEISIEVLDADGKSLAGWSEKNQAVFKGNTHACCGIGEQKVQWPQGKQMNELKGKIIRLAFTLNNARLFTITAQAPNQRSWQPPDYRRGEMTVQY